MSVVIPLEADAHMAVRSLLPWYARAQLGDDDRSRVQRHLMHCQACRDELDAERQLQSLLTLADSAASEVGQVDAGLARMHARLQPVKPERRAPRWVPWALGVQGTAIAALMGLWLHARPADPPAEPAYRGLSATPSASLTADALVMFRPGTSEQALRELLQSQGAGIVAGPTETGAYLLRIDARGLAALRRAPIVATAESLQPGSAR